MKKVVILVLVLIGVALFLSKKSEKSQEDSLEGNSDTEEADSVDTESDEEFCSMARKDNTRAAWEKYLKKFPEGKCAEEGKTVNNKFKKIDGLEWSELSKKKMFHLDAEEACSQLRAGGHEDWRLPTIDELRTLVQNHPGTVSDGKCRIFEKILLDSEDNCSENNILERVEKYLDNSCKGVDGKIFSKLGDTDVLWSYTAVCEPFRANIWGLDFSNGGISSYRGNGENEDALKFRCVRQDDADACETAKKYDISYYWEKYLENYPNGKCAGEAKAFLKKWEEMFRDTVQDEIEKEKVK